MYTVFLNYKAKLNQNEEKVSNFYKSSKIKQIDPNKLSPGVSWPKGTQKGRISSNPKSDYISRRPKKKKKAKSKALVSLIVLLMIVLRLNPRLPWLLSLSEEGTVLPHSRPDLTE